jgi:flagellar motility protein MotE (MotC chaperone)
MNRPLKLIVFSALLLHLSGIFLNSKISNNIYTVSGNLAFAQEEEQKEEAQPEEPKKEAEDDQSTEDKKGDPPKEGKEKTPEKIKLPKQNTSINPETFRMMEMIEKKKKELENREKELVSKEQQLKTLEENIQKNLEKIEQALKESKEQFGMKESLIKKNVDSLIKVYSTMKPAEAANLIAAIDEDLALRIISGMKSKIAGQVLSQLDVKVAKAITEKLAGKTTTPKKQP